MEIFKNKRLRNALVVIAGVLLVAPALLAGLVMLLGTAVFGWVVSAVVYGADGEFSFRDRRWGLVIAPAQRPPFRVTRLP